MTGGFIIVGLVGNQQTVRPVGRNFRMAGDLQILRGLKYVLSNMTMYPLVKEIRRLNILIQVYRLCEKYCSIKLLKNTIQMVSKSLLITDHLMFYLEVRLFHVLKIKVSTELVSKGTILS